MLTENKSGKYIKYAIGEILLVVIGIIIALQLNNWNENRKIQKNEITILEQLNADLKKNQEELFEIKSLLKQSAENSKKFLLFLSSKKNHTDSISEWLKDIGRNPIFNNANTAYKNLENSPNKIISNDSLRLRITMIYEKDFRNIDVRENGYKTQYFPDFKRHQRENFIMTTGVSEEDNELIFNYNTPRNVENLKENDGFKNSLVDLYNFTKLRIKLLTLTENRLQVLIKDIDREIERLQH